MGESGIHFAEVSVFDRTIGKNRHFRDFSHQALSGVVALRPVIAKARLFIHLQGSCPCTFMSFPFCELFHRCRYAAFMFY